MITGAERSPEPDSSTYGEKTKTHARSARGVRPTRKPMELLKSA